MNLSKSINDKATFHFFIATVYLCFCHGRDQSYYMNRWRDRMSVNNHLLRRSTPKSPLHVDSQLPSPTQTLPTLPNNHIPDLLNEISPSIYYHNSSTDENYSTKVVSSQNGFAKTKASKSPILKPVPVLSDRKNLIESQYDKYKPKVSGFSSPVLTSPINPDYNDPYNTQTSYYEREPRWLSFFNFVTIPATACLGSNSENGTCYTSSECSSLGGTSVGSCFSNIGTCCSFQKTCGSISNENGTTFVNTGFPTSFDGVGSCQLTVNKITSSICQLRLDFDQLVLSPPDSTDQTCNNDRLAVSGGSSTPVICGTSTGNHMYVDLGPGTTAPVVITVITMGPSFQRNWNIRISQIPCNVNYAAPSNCLQYHAGVTGMIQSFNYDLTTGLQLSNQDYTICVRTEKNFCGIQYDVCPDSVNTPSQAFSISGNVPNNPVGSLAGQANCDLDWITIPCVSDNNRNPTSNCQDRLCGDFFNVQESTSAGNVPLFSYVKPFTIYYRTDDTEGSASPSELNNRGFCFNYVQQPCI